RDYGDGTIGLTCDETTTLKDLDVVVTAFNNGKNPEVQWSNLDLDRLLGEADFPSYERASKYLQHPVFNSYHAETQMLRYIKRLENRDRSLAQSMIPLGSCTMKLNATSEMLPVTWAEFSRMHPYAPAEQTQGYVEMFRQLEKWLAEITGFAAVSLQPNAG